MNIRTELLTLGLLLALSAGCAVNPISGEEELILFGPEDDLELGRQYAPRVEKELDGNIEDDQLQSYIDRIGQKIASVSHRPDWKYHFTAVEHESINALAVPGGYVFITRGLLEKLTSEAQLAGILGHEVAHVVARDSAAAISRQFGMDMLLLAIQVSGAPGDAVRAAAFTRQILSLRYSRKDEQEADIAGLDYMVRAGYNPYGLLETMQVLQEQQTRRPIEFFSTHPLPENRIRYLTDAINTKYWNLEGLKTGQDSYQTIVLESLKKKKKK
jgi:predicted Zn-dependent protease